MYRPKRRAISRLGRSRRVRTIRSFAPGITRDNSGIRGMPTLASGLRISSISSQLGPVETIPQTHRGPHGLSMIRSAADLGRVPKKTRRGRGKAAASVQRIVSRTGFRGPGLGASADSGGRRFGLRNPERSTGSRCAYASRHPRYPGVIPGYPGYKTFDRAQGGDRSISSALTVSFRIRRPLAKLSSTSARTSWGAPGFSWTLDCERVLAGGSVEMRKQVEESAAAEGDRSGRRA